MADYVHALQVGSRVGPYEVTRVLGAGGFGITYEAVHRVLRRRASVALKEFFPSGMAARDGGTGVIYERRHQDMIDWALRKFEETTTALSELDHPSIVQVWEYLPANNTAYMVMEMVEGDTFAHRLRDRAGLPGADEVRPLVEPVLDALEYLHGQGLIHRDIAPDNILICRDGRPVLIDFGAVSRSHATAPDGAPGGAPLLTGTVGIVKAHYTAPDQASPKARPDPTSDVYSIAAVLYRALAGEPPPEGLERVLGDDPYRPLAGLHLPGCPPAIAAAVDAALGVRKADRPQSIAALRGALGWTQPAGGAWASRPAPAGPPGEAETRLAPAIPAPSRPDAPIPLTVSVSAPGRRPLAVAASLAAGALGLSAAAFYAGQTSSRRPAIEASRPIAERPDAAPVAGLQPAAPAESGGVRPLPAALRQESAHQDSAYQDSAPSPAPTPPRAAAPEPATPPVADFTRHNGGWSVTLSFADPVTAIAWRLGESGPYRETGFLDVLDPRTRRRLPNPSIQLDADAPAGTLHVRAVGARGEELGPFPIRFEPVAALERGQRRILEMTAGSWVALREFNGLLLYTTHLVSYRCAIREVRIGVDSAVPDRAVPLPPCDPRNPNAIPSDVKPYMTLPPATRLVSVELTYRDGSVSEVRTFRR